MRIALGVVCLLMASIVVAQRGNNFPVPAKPAQTLDEQLLEVTVSGVSLGMTEDEVDAALKAQRNKDGGVHYRIQEIEKHCEERNSARWCVYPDFNTPEFQLPLVTRFSADRLIGIFFEAPQAGRLRGSLRNFMTTFAKDLAEEISPTKSKATAMVWVGENIVWSIDWGVCKLMYLNASELWKLDSGP